MSVFVAHKEATDSLHLQWLEAAYVYYLHPEFDPVMTDEEWDIIARRLVVCKVIENGKSLFPLREEDYPISIRQKYKQC